MASPQISASKARKRKVLRWFGLGLLALAMWGSLGAGALIGTVWWFGRHAGDVDPATLKKYSPIQVTRVLSRDGTVIGEFFTEERRTVVSYEELPDHVVQAFLAAEDADFFAHRGMDWFGIGRAVLVNASAGELRQGASTITQQVVKNTLLSQERTVERKSEEIILAQRLEHVLTKQEILWIYLNEIYFGEGRYGIEEAARYYYGKSARELDVGEAATLAALPRAPGKITPYRDAERTKARQTYVLRQMAAKGFIDSEVAQEYIALPLRVVSHPDPSEERAPEFVDAAKEFLTEHYGAEALPYLGATVLTTVDLELQKEARGAVARGLDDLERRHDYGQHARPSNPRHRERIATKAPTRLEVGSRLAAVVESVDLEAGELVTRIGPHPVTVALPEALRADARRRFPEGDVVRVHVTELRAGSEGVGRLVEGPQAALLLADTATGEIRAMIGGRAHRRGHFNRALYARRQPGSTFKPWVFLAALREKTLTASSRLPGHQGRPTTLRHGLAHSDNAIALALHESVGPDAIHRVARDVGIESPLTPHASLALGASELTLPEQLAAYMTVAREGRSITPHFIVAVDLNRVGTPGFVETQHWEGDWSNPDAGLPAPEASLLTSLLGSVVEEGSGVRARALGRPVAGKTGTTNDNHDAWFVGFTADHVCVTWVGFDRPEPLGRTETGARAALPIWVDAMQAAEHGAPESFPIHEELLVRTVDPSRGSVACVPTDTWHVPGHCDTFWFFQECEPARDVRRSTYLRCSDPVDWRDELYLPGSGPAASPGESSRRGHRVALRSLSLFGDSDGTRQDIEARRASTEPLRAWVQDLDEQWAPHAGRSEQTGTTVFELRFDRNGQLDESRLVAGSGHEVLDRLASWAIQAQARARVHPLHPPLVDPVSGQAQIRVEFVVDADPDAIARR